MSERAHKLSVGKIAMGQGAPFFVIAGPCVIESEAHALMMAERLAGLARELNVPLIFKASYDKANRSSVNSFRGPGLKEGLRILGEVKKKFALPILTDVHEDLASGTGGGSLRRDSDSRVLVSADGSADCGGKIGTRGEHQERTVCFAVGNGKRGGESREHRKRKIILTERGASFGYQNLVVDMRSFPILRKLGYPVVFDVTHAVQLPGGEGKSSGGQPEFIEPLARAGTAAGVDGIFMEVHDNPAKALSDGANALALEKFKPMVERITKIAALAREWEKA